MHLVCLWKQLIEIATHVTEVARDGVKPKPETLEPKEKEEKAAAAAPSTSGRYS